MRAVVGTAAAQRQSAQYNPLGVRTLMDRADCRNADPSQFGLVVKLELLLRGKRSFTSVMLACDLSVAGLRRRNLTVICLESRSATCVAEMMSRRCPWRIWTSCGPSPV